MIARRRWASLHAAVLCSACVVTTSVGSDTGAAIGTTTSDAITTTTTGELPASTSTSTSTSSTGDAPQSTGTDLDTGTTTGGEDPLDVCMSITIDGAIGCIPQVDDSACVACVKLTCCAALVTCDSLATCVCLLVCAQGGGSPSECTQTCGATDGSCDLSNCGQTECAQVCS